MSAGARPPVPERSSVTYIIGTYPLLTTTFIDREIEMLRRLGTDVEVVSLRRPDCELSAHQHELAATTIYVRPARATTVVADHLRFFTRRPVRYLGTLLRLVSGAGQSLRERALTVGHFGLAVTVTGTIARGGRPDRLHAHFVDRAAIVAHVASRLLDIPYSVTAHASDIYVSPVLLDTKIGGADFVTTCTRYNEAHLRREVPAAGDKLSLIYHGIDVSRFEPVTANGDGVPIVLAVGQLKEKKGFVHLLEACRRLADRGVRFRCEIVGDGPQRSELVRRISELDLDGIVELKGALTHDQVIECYRRATVFTLASVRADNGDRDGIPNVILEAMAMELAVVSTTLSGIPEAVEHDGAGLLAPPGDPDALADALERVLRDPDERRRMGRQGRETVIARFDLETNTRLLRERLDPAGATR